MKPNINIGNTFLIKLNFLDKRSNNDEKKNMRANMVPFGLLHNILENRPIAMVNKILAE